MLVEDFTKSPNWQDLAEIDSRISKLGFGMQHHVLNRKSAERNDFPVRQ